MAKIRQGERFLKYCARLSLEEQEAVLQLVGDAVRFLCFGQGAAFEKVPAGLAIELRRGNQSVWFRSMLGDLEVANATLDRAKLEQLAADADHALSPQGLGVKVGPSGVVIDSRGRGWPDDSPDLARLYGYGPPDAAFMPYAIRERGCIHLVRQADTVRITLRAGKFTLRTLLGALLALERWPSRILLSIYDGAESSHGMFMSIGTFAEYAEDLARDKPARTAA